MCPTLYLASSSPQRRRMLQSLGLVFEVIHPHIDESTMDGESARDYVSRLAVEKACKGMSLVSNSSDLAVVLGADTCVAIDDLKLGKPSSRIEAMRMLKLLSGRVHEVHSAVAVRHDQISRVTTVTSKVEFSALTERQLEDFLDSGESQQRAGAYAIQGQAAAFVNRLDGSWSAVVGMPVVETIDLLRKVGVSVPDDEMAVRNVEIEFPAPRAWDGQYRT